MRTFIRSLISRELHPNGSLQPGSLKRPARRSWADLTMPGFMSLMTLLVVGIVFLILGIILWEGRRELSVEFVVNGVDRGFDFNGGRLYQLRLERAGEADDVPEEFVALEFTVATGGQPAIAEYVELYPNEGKPSAILQLRDGSEIPSSQRGHEIGFPGSNATLLLEIPFDREAEGRPQEVRIIAGDLPQDTASLQLSLLIQNPLGIAGLDERLDLTPAGEDPLRVASPGVLALLEGDQEIAITRIPRSGVMPMIFGTVALVFIMIIMVVPFGVMAAIYLHEYANRSALSTRIIRGAVNNLAGVPSVVFGLFGLGFFVAFCGAALDRVIYGGERVFQQPCLLWAAATLAVLTLPVVIVSTEESLRAIPQGLRSASLALGATKWQTTARVVLPNALPGILTGVILALGRGAGEVAPILFTGATNFLPHLPWNPTEKFMELGYHIYILSTQSPDVERTRGILFTTVVVLIGLTVCMNFIAIVVRARLGRKFKALLH